MFRTIARAASVAVAAVLAYIVALLVLTLMTGLTGRAPGGYEALVVVLTAVVFAEIWAWRRMTRWIDGARRGRATAGVAATR